MEVGNVGQGVVVDSLHLQPQTVVAARLLPPAEQRREDVKSHPAFVPHVDDPAVEQPVDWLGSFPARSNYFVDEDLLLPPPLVALLLRRRVVVARSVFHLLFGG